MKEVPLDDVDARQGVIADVLEKHALPDLISDSIELPELDDAKVAEMSDAYDADMDIIADIEGVELILPFD